MPFSESLKDEVKRKSHFRCCICRNYFVEVHHIIPQAENGPDDIDNAAPLCPTCHDSFGNNPDKRRTIRQMRDQWYELCAKSETNPDVLQFSTKLDGLYTEFQTLRLDQEKQNATLNDMRSLFSAFYETQAQQMQQVGTIGDLIVASGIVTSGSVPPQGYGTTLGVTCKACGQYVYGYSAKYCSNCGTKLP
jgi:hypothetical protein